MTSSSSAANKPAGSGRRSRSEVRRSRGSCRINVSERVLTSINPVSVNTFTVKQLRDELWLTEGGAVTKKEARKLRKSKLVEEVIKLRKKKMEDSQMKEDSQMTTGDDDDNKDDDKPTAPASISSGSLPTGSCYDVWDEKLYVDYFGNWLLNGKGHEKGTPTIWHAVEYVYIYIYIYIYIYLWIYTRTPRALRARSVLF